MGFQAGNAQAPPGAGIAPNPNLAASPQGLFGGVGGVGSLPGGIPGGAGNLPQGMPNGIPGGAGNLPQGMPTNFGDWFHNRVIQRYPEMNAIHGGAGQVGPRIMGGQGVNNGLANNMQSQLASTLMGRK